MLSDSTSFFLQELICFLINDAPINSLKYPHVLEQKNGRRK
jgi:hypothetical protein